MASKKNPHPKRGTPHGDSIVGICWCCDDERNPVRVADSFVIDLAGRIHHVACLVRIDELKRACGA